MWLFRVAALLLAISLSALPAAAKPHLAQIARSIVGSPASLKKLSPVVHTAAVHAYVHTIDTVFRVATPVVLLAFVFSLFLPEIRLRATVRGQAPPAPGAAADGADTVPSTSEALVI